jgi:hypothetical protein
VLLDERLLSDACREPMTRDCRASSDRRNPDLLVKHDSSARCPCSFLWCICAPSPSWVLLDEGLPSDAYDRRSLRFIWLAWLTPLHSGGSGVGKDRLPRA